MMGTKKKHLLEEIRNLKSDLRYERSRADRWSSMCTDLQHSVDELHQEIDNLDAEREKGQIEELCQEIDNLREQLREYEEYVGDLLSGRP